MFPFPFAGITENVAPLQISVCWSNTNGLGATLMFTKKLFPTQPPAAPEVGSTWYVMTCIWLVVLVNTWLIELLDIDWADCPVKLLLSVKIVQV